jgi:hypothetical protein
VKKRSSTSRSSFERYAVYRPGVWVSLFFLCVGAAFALSSWKLPGGQDEPGPGFMPLLVSVGLLVSIIWVLSKEAVDSRKNVESAHSSEAITWKHITLICALLAYYFVLPFAGFLISTCVMMLVMFKIFGLSGIVGPVIASLLSTGLVYISFVELLNISLNSL